MRSIRKITFKPRWQTNLSVVLVSEWWVNTPITELGDIARHSARWRGINWNLKKKKKKKNFFFFFFGVPCINRTPDFEFFSAAKKCGLYTVIYGTIYMPGLAYTSSSSSSIVQSAVGVLSYFVLVKCRVYSASKKALQEFYVQLKNSLKLNGAWYVAPSAWKVPKRCNPGPPPPPPHSVLFRVRICLYPLFEKTPSTANISKPPFRGLFTGFSCLGDPPKSGTLLNVPPYLRTCR